MGVVDVALPVELVGLAEEKEEENEVERKEVGELGRELESEGFALDGLVGGDFVTMSFAGD